MAVGQNKKNEGPPCLFIFAFANRFFEASFFDLQPYGFLKIQDLLLMGFVHGPFEESLINKLSRAQDSQPVLPLGCAPSNMCFEMNPTKKHPTSSPAIIALALPPSASCNSIRLDVTWTSMSPPKRPNPKLPKRKATSKVGYPPFWGAHETPKIEKKTNNAALSLQHLCEKGVPIGHHATFPGQSSSVGTP